MSNSRSTAELGRGALPLLVGNVFCHLLNVVLERNDPDGIRVRLAEDGPQTRDLLSKLERELLGVNARATGNPVAALLLDFGHLRSLNWARVGEVES